MEAPRQSQKFNIHPKLLEAFGQYQLADNLISIHFSNLKQNKQYINQCKVSKLKNQEGRQKQKYLSDYDQFSTQFLDLEETVKNIRRNITGQSEHGHDETIQNSSLLEAKQKWRILYQKNNMKTKQALRYASFTAKIRQSRQITFRNWKFAHFQIPIYKRPNRDLFTVFVPLFFLAIITFYLFWIGSAGSARQGYAATMITTLSFLSGGLVPISRIAKPSIIGVGFFEILIFFSLLPSLILLLNIGFQSTDDKQQRNIQEIQRVRSIYLVVALSFQCLIVFLLAFSTIFYCCLRRRESLRAKEIREHRTCCLEYHFLRLQQSQNTHGKLFDLHKWYNNECCRNFILYVKRKTRDWHKQYISRKNLNVQEQNYAIKQFIKLPLRKGSQISSKIFQKMKNESYEDVYLENPVSDVRIKSVY